jgi:ABC-2 type transport system ATP-binding protein
MPLLEVEGLSKDYGETIAVDNISFEVEEGEIFGLLGPNGAGKSTTVSILSGVLPPSRGEVRLAGIDVVRNPLAAKALIGVVPQDVALYDELSAAENLSFFGRLHGLAGARLRERLAFTLETVGLAERAREPVKRYSGGMKRRLNLAVGLLHQPRILILDEPTVGIDPQGRVRILDVVRQEAASSSTTVLYTTHYMEEAESLCDRVAIMDEGRILVQGTVQDLKLQAGQQDVIKISGSFPNDPSGAFTDVAGSRVARVTSEEIIISVDDAEATLSIIIGRLTSGGAAIRKVEVEEPTLETLFIHLTGRELRD